MQSHPSPGALLYPASLKTTIAPASAPAPVIRSFAPEAVPPVSGWLWLSSHQLAARGSLPCLLLKEIASLLLTFLSFQSQRHVYLYPRSPAWTFSWIFSAPLDLIPFFSSIIVVPYRRGERYVFLKTTYLLPPLFFPHLASISSVLSTFFLNWCCSH